MVAVEQVGKSYRVIDHPESRIVAWGGIRGSLVYDLTWYFGVFGGYRFSGEVPDEHLAFCRGEMPAAIYADFLEEQVVPLPAKLYDRLRGWEE